LLRQRQIFYRRRPDHAVSDEKLVKRPQRAEPELNCRAAQVLPAQKTEVRAKIIALKFFPGDCLSRRSGFIRDGGPFLVMPVGKFPQRLPVIPLGVNRRPAVRGQVREKSLNPLVHWHRVGC
jgi:hypothetical protein